MRIKEKKGRKTGEKKEEKREKNEKGGRKKEMRTRNIGRERGKVRRK